MLAAHGGAVHGQPGRAPFRAGASRAARLPRWGIPTAADGSAGAQCKRIYESWLVQDTVELVENASPAPVLVRTVLARAFPEQDTLGYRCRVLQFVATGSAFYSDGARLSSQAIVNSFARLHIAEEGFPVAGFITHELKLQLWLGGEPLPGVHYCNVFYRLAERRTPQVTAPSSGPELKRPARRPRRR
jgi:hypothetical protein